MLPRAPPALPTTLLVLCVLPGRGCRVAALLLLCRTAPSVLTKLGPSLRGWTKATADLSGCSVVANDACFHYKLPTKCEGKLKLLMLRSWIKSFVGIIPNENIKNTCGEKGKENHFLERSIYVSLFFITVFKNFIMETLLIHTFEKYSLCLSSLSQSRSVLIQCLLKQAVVLPCVCVNFNLEILKL